MPASLNSTSSLLTPTGCKNLFKIVDCLTWLPKSFAGSTRKRYAEVVRGCSPNNTRRARFYQMQPPLIWFNPCCASHLN
jgi:hypothetical protein